MFKSKKLAIMLMLLTLHLAISSKSNAASDVSTFALGTGVGAALVGFNWLQTNVYSYLINKYNQENAPLAPQDIQEQIRRTASNNYQAFEQDVKKTPIHLSAITLDQINTQKTTIANQFYIGHNEHSQQFKAQEMKNPVSLTVPEDRVTSFFPYIFKADSHLNISYSVNNDDKYIYSTPTAVTSHTAQVGVSSHAYLKTFGVCCVSGLMALGTKKAIEYFTR
ncbi:MAG TPA: hypothetical protein VHO47_04590 [Candidatus Babeliales bacterium]|nr:hypothetical protein [Candidatus Babeliales bacterium]